MIYTSNKTILHIDADCFYASCHIAEKPSLKGKCIAVCGDIESRHGIILAKSYEAKRKGVKTGEAIWEAKDKCADLLLIRADYKMYKYYSDLLRQIYFKYTDQVEAFGLDENWLDVTASKNLFGTGLEIAEQIQKEVIEQTGLTVSIGIGWNKVISKFGSDYNKPNGITNITINNFKEIFWEAPVEDLLYVGRATKIKYNNWGLFKIKDIALDINGLIERHGNKVDKIIQWWSKGYDSTEVHNIFEAETPVKSVGNSITTSKDLETIEDVKIVYTVLCESVATRLKRIGKQGSVITITLRTSDLTSFSKQRKIDYYTNISIEILMLAMQLVKENYDFQKPLRSIGVKVSSLKEDTNIVQADFFGREEKRLEEKNIDKTIDKIRNKYGHKCIKRCITVLDEELGGFNPLVNNTVHPVATKLQ